MAKAKKKKGLKQRMGDLTRRVQKEREAEKKRLDHNLALKYHVEKGKRNDSAYNVSENLIDTVRNPSGLNIVFTGLSAGTAYVRNNNLKTTRKRLDKEIAATKRNTPQSSANRGPKTPGAKPASMKASQPFYYRTVKNKKQRVRKGRR